MDLFFHSYLACLWRDAGRVLLITSIIRCIGLIVVPFGSVPFTKRYHRYVNTEMKSCSIVCYFFCLDRLFLDSLSNASYLGGFFGIYQIWVSFPFLGGGM